MNPKRFIKILVLMVLSVPVWGQKTSPDTSLTIPMIYAQYGYQWPGGDMADRYGSNSAIGGGFMIKTHSNWMVGVEYNYLFGNNTKDGFDILDDIMTSEGIIISGDGTPALVALFERGHVGTFKIGKLFPVLGPDDNSGFFFTAGLGVLTHKTRIEVENQSAPQLKGDYRRGYDRLTAGLQLNQAIGYMYIGKSNIANFILSFEIFEGFTKGQRDMLFDTRQPGNDSQFDLLFGPKLSWTIPIRKRGPEEFYYY
jgi:hypothetical protein